MRTRTMILTGALLASSAAVAAAQQTAVTLPAASEQTVAAAPPQGAPAARPAPDVPLTPGPKLGTIDFGFRGSSVDGDSSRYYRFKDWRDGGYLSGLRFEKVTDTTLWHAEAHNVGYRDQRCFGEFQSIGKIKVNGEWNEIPLFISDDTRTLYTVSKTGTFNIDDNIQKGIESGATTLANVIGQASPFNARTQRDTALFNLTYSATRDVDLKFAVRNSMRDGYNLQSLNFGFSNTIESEVPLNDRTTDVKAGIEFANAKGLLSVGYNGSWYNNQLTAYRFDNPLRYTDIVGGPSVGQMSTPPSTDMQTLNLNGRYGLPGRTKASAAISVGNSSQNQALLPATVNTALVSPTLERSTAEAEARTLSMVYTVNSRPSEDLWLNAKYRYYDYDTRTPSFFISSMVVADNTLGAAKETEPLDVKRQTLDLEASYTPFQYASLNFGYSREDADRTFRIYEKTAENVLRASIDSTGNQYFTVRAVVEKSTRTGSGDDFEMLAEIGEQTGMRHFDIANRDRTRSSVIVTVTPMTAFGFNGSVSTGHDDYSESYFGLRDNKNNSYSLGFDFVPRDTVNFGIEYVHEKYTAVQWSRTSNPLPSPSFDDPSRDWGVDSDDKVDTVTANLDFIKTLPKTDIRFGYDWSDGQSTYVYNLGPNSTVLTGINYGPGNVFNPIPIAQVAPNKTTLTTGRADVQYLVRANVALGLGYWYEQYRAQDYSLNGTTINQLNLPSAILSGYYYRPYTGQTVWLRMSYLW
ncbi:MAG: MtrB/PioB family outer membrane beta-barrel protein [Acidobacteria bacterium]|nr:MtrB/PioB family outer membrane beta-barrel protein [Acidobacteriota bacterium]